MNSSLCLMNKITFFFLSVAHSAAPALPLLFLLHIKVYRSVAVVVATLAFVSIPFSGAQCYICTLVLH